MQTRRLCAIGPRRGGELGCWRRAGERAGAPRGAEARAPAPSPRLRRSGARDSEKGRAWPGRRLAARGGGWRRASNRKCTACRALPSPPRAVARGAVVPCGRGGAGPTLTPGDHPPPHSVGHDPTHTHTLKHAHVPHRPGGGGSAGVSVGCALTSTCVWKTGALPAELRSHLAGATRGRGRSAGFHCHPPPPRSRLFQVHQGTRGKGRARSPQAGSAGHAGLLRRRRKWWGSRAGNAGRGAHVLPRSQPHA